MAASRRGAAWIEQAEFVRQRDDWTCQHCGTESDEHDEKLHVHHLVPEREILDDPHRADNLVLLCQSCHYRLERLPLERQLEKLGLESRDDLERPGDRHPIDDHLLEMLEEGRIHLEYAEARLNDTVSGNFPREYIRRRLLRLERSGDVAKIHDSGVYELKDSPRPVAKTH